jgi:hypothetical protein
MIQVVINFLIAQIIALIPQDWQQNAIDKAADITKGFVKDKIDEFLDWIEDMVIQSENKIDDYVLYLTNAIRQILDIPDIEPEAKFLDKLSSVDLTKLSREDYPKPFEKTKTELFVIGGKQNRPIEDLFTLVLIRGTPIILKEGIEFIV